MARTRPEQPILTGRIIDLISRTPSVADAREQIAATEKKLTQTRQQLDGALQAEERALLALADGMDEAAEARDTARRDARRFKDESHDLERLLEQQTRRLADAQAAEKRAADAAVWRRVDELFAARVQAGARADAAMAELGEALRDLEHQTALLAVLMGPAADYIQFTEPRGHLRIQFGEALDGHKRPVPTRPLADVVEGQHAEVRRNVRL